MEFKFFTRFLEKLLKQKEIGLTLMFECKAGTKTVRNVYVEGDNIKTE